MYIERPGYSDDKTVIVRCCSQLEVVRLENHRFVCQLLIGY